MTKRHLALICVSAVLVLICGFPGIAQVTTGAPPLGTMRSGGADQIDLANLNVHIPVPIMNKSGRGVPFTYSLSYDSSVWYPVTSGSTHTWQPVLNWGWTSQSSVSTGYLSFTMSDSMCYSYDSDLNPIYDGDTYSLQNFVYHDSFGTSHQLDYSETDAFSGYGNLSGSGLPVTYSNCSTYSSSSGSQKALDGSDYSIQGTYWSWQMVAPSGNVMTMPYNMQSGAASLTDANGNQVSVNGSGQFFDTLSSSTPVLTVGGAGTQSSPNTFQYAAPSGTATYTMKYTNKNVKTNFGCSGITEYSANNVPLVTEIDLPDQAVNTSDRYTFTYEATPSHSGYYTGRIASVTLPTGGTITYSYSGGNNGIVCADGSTATLTRSTPDTGSSYWTYAHSESGAAWTTTVTDPQSPSNQSVMNFQGPYLTTKKDYSGSSSSGTLLRTLYTCYNGNTPNCDSTAITLPISEAKSYLQWGSSGLETMTDIKYSNSLVYETDEYPYGAGAPGSTAVRKITTAYASLTNNIVNHPSQVNVYDGSGVLVGETTYSYDGSSLVTTSGTPQRVSVSGSRGNLTSVSSYISSSVALTKSFTYYDTGNVSVATDVNGGTTTYNYSSSTASCGNAFPTSITEAISSLSESMTWNCAGGVQLTATDENNNTATMAYNDSYFWRPASGTDQLSSPNTTNFTYAGPNSVEAAMNFNSTSSTTDVLATTDSLGRLHVSQLRNGQGSSTLDSVETGYDNLGRPITTTQPYNAFAGYTCSGTCPVTTTSYDALGRTTEVEDANGGFLTYAYYQNDVYQSAGPKPSSDANTKDKQLEYDALGRLTSVCEVTSGTTRWPSASCGQTHSATGYLTTYTYDLNNNLTGVTQNAQASSDHQTRSYTYDFLNRMTSESNPETGTIYYVYDSDSTCGTYHGDLVKKTDNIVNVTCYAYDALRRITSKTFPSGPDASRTPNKYFVYDSATVNSVAMSNAKAQLAEAYTCTSCPGTKITDLGLSYTKRGETADTYESTPNSGGYFHVSETYWANGAVNTISGLSGVPTITYGVDGEGRTTTASASSGTNPVSSTSYNYSSLPTAVTFGSSDSDAFTYDGNTNRLTQYQFNVGSSSVTGNLTWNTLGTLGTLAITDPFDSANAQTCNYAHDDLARIMTFDCGSGNEGESYTYDPFGNITKSVPSGRTGYSYGPSYSPSTNQMGDTGVTYDNNGTVNNGNVTNDTMNSYAWDSNGRPTTINSVGVTYDALGNMVEQNRSSSYTQIVYAPDGTKLGLMSGTGTLQKAFVPLTGGAAAVYTSSPSMTPSYYRHSDWIGSSRFASTPGQTMYSDTAYDPFGQAYAQSGTADLSFTGMNQDSSSNVYDFPGREFGGHGRWASPDPMGMGAADSADPQSWNRYAYVRNSPLSITDPDGLDYYACINAAGFSGGCYTTPDYATLDSDVYAVGGYLSGDYNSGVIVVPDGSGNYYYFDPNPPPVPPGPGNDGNPSSGGSTSTGVTGVLSKIKQAVHSAVCAVTQPLVRDARANGTVGGYGVGGSAGIGFLWGASASFAAHIVADPGGNVAIAVSYSWNPGNAFELGIGAYGGLQGVSSTARNLKDFGGSSFSGSIGGGYGVGGGVGVSASKTSVTVTATAGAGVGGIGGAFETGGTSIPGLTSTNCNP